MSSLTASTVFNVRLRQVFGLSLQIFYISSAQDVFLFFSLSLYLLFFSPSSNGQLWHEQTTFPSSITKSLDKVPGKCHVLTPWCYVSWRTTAHGQVDGHHFWFSRKQVRCYLQSADTLQLALWRTCFNKRKIKFLLQPSTGWINWERFRYDPNFPDAYDRRLVLQVTPSVWLCFLF